MGPVRQLGNLVTGVLGAVIGLVSALLGGVLALVLSLVATLLLVVAAVLCATILLLPLGIPLGALALRLYGQAMKMLVPKSPGLEARLGGVRSAIRRRLPGRRRRGWRKLLNR